MIAGARYYRGLCRRRFSGSRIQPERKRVARGDTKAAIIKFRVCEQQVARICKPNDVGIVERPKCYRIDLFPISDVPTVVAEPLANRDEPANDGGRIYPRI